MDPIQPLVKVLHFLVLPVGAEAISGYIHYGALIPNKDFIASFEDGDERANEKGFFFTSYPSMDDPEKIVTFEPAIYKYFDPQYRSSGWKWEKYTFD